MNADRMGGEAGFAPMWRPLFEGGDVEMVVFLVEK